MRPRLYAIPDDADTPYPVDEKRLWLAVTQCHQPIEANGTVEIDGIPFHVSLAPDLRYFSVRTRWSPAIPYHQVETTLFALADAWNRERFFPTLYLAERNNGHAEVVIDYIVDCQDGLSENQLHDALKVGFDVGPEALFYIQDAAESVLGLSDDMPLLPT